MRRTKNGYTPAQFAYAKNQLGGKGKTKKEIALRSGYSPSVAHSVMQKIESTEGYHNAMCALAGETGNLMLKIYHELGTRDLSKESLPTLLNAVSTMANAWETFTPKQSKDDDSNPLRNIILAHATKPKTVKALPVKETDTKKK